MVPLPLWRCPGALVRIYALNVLKTVPVSWSAESATRQLDYLMTMPSRIRWWRMNHDMAVRIEAARSTAREEDVERAVIKSLGLPLEPPVGWKDPAHPGQRTPWLPAKLQCSIGRSSKAGSTGGARTACHRPLSADVRFPCGLSAFELLYPGRLAQR